MCLFIGGFPTGVTDDFELRHAHSFTVLGLHAFNPLLVLHAAHHDAVAWRWTYDRRTQTLCAAGGQQLCLEVVAEAGMLAFLHIKGLVKWKLLVRPRAPDRFDPSARVDCVGQSGRAWNANARLLMAGPIKLSSSPGDAPGQPAIRGATLGLRPDATRYLQPSVHASSGRGAWTVAEWKGGQGRTHCATTAQGTHPQPA